MDNGMITEHGGVYALVKVGVEVEVARSKARSSKRDQLIRESDIC